MAHENAEDSFTEMSAPGSPIVFLPTLAHAGKVLIRDVDVHELNARRVSVRPERLCWSSDFCAAHVLLKTPSDLLFGAEI